MFKDDNTKRGLRIGCLVMLAGAVAAIALIWLAGRVAGAW